jgi:hypothetical protein
MESLGLVPLLFVIAPGFVADGLYKAVRGTQIRSSEVEAVLRSIVWSTIGLGLFASLKGKLPTYIDLATWAGTGTVHPKIDRSLGGALLIHFSCCLSVAFLYALLARSRWLFIPVAKLFARSTVQTPMGTVFQIYGKGRPLGVTTKSGKVYWGEMLATRLDSEHHDVVLTNIVDNTDPTNPPIPVLDAVALFIPSDEIREVRVAHLPPEG